MNLPSGHHEYLRKHYPDIFNLWAEAVNADFEVEFLLEQGKTEEAEKMAKKHEELWDEYCFAAKLVLTESD